MPDLPPVPSIAMLRQRAALVARTREFFRVRAVLEVDTPILGHGVVVEAHIDPIPCRADGPVGEGPRDRFLLASPEGPMKRLLAAGSGAIYQFAHAFRDGEVGRRHSPEFTILEWYRPGFDHHALMDEVEALVRALLPALTPALSPPLSPALSPAGAEAPFERRTYRQLFIEGVGIDPFATSLAELRAACERLAVPLPAGFSQATIDAALDLLLVSHLEPALGKPAPLFVYDYPVSQAALARVREAGDGGHRVASRFELYIDGLELANGYHELGDPAEQRRRFEQANRDRAARGRRRLPMDEALLAALGRGFPACAGVALGFDRLVMVATGADHIDAVRQLPG